VQTLRFERSGQVGEVMVPLPEEGGPVRLRFESDAFFVPREQGVSPDDRRLALQAGPLCVEPAGEEAGEEGAAGWLTAGDRAAQRGRWVEACAAYIEALRRQRNCAEARAGLGLALLAQGEVEEGLAQLEEGVRLRPTPDLVADLASGLLAAGRTAEGERLLRGVLAADPGHLAARANLAALEAAIPAGAGCGPIDAKGETRCGS
jgi:tetratricopeptide (TPR) repeat protein